MIAYLMFFQIYLCEFASFVPTLVWLSISNEVKMGTDPNPSQEQFHFFTIPQPDVHDCARPFEFIGFLFFLL